MEKQYNKVMALLKKRYDGKAASEKPTPWECLLFTALSARTRDEQTDIAFNKLMAKYPTVAALAGARQQDVERLLSTIGLYRAKAKAAIAAAKMIMVTYGGKVPTTIEELVTIPGVGRKTASCVLVYAHNLPAIPVDTHVHRIVNRLGWVKTVTPEKTEQALRATLPARHWHDINRVMVFFGREICIPGRPRCYNCPVAQYCTYPKKTPSPPTK